MILRNLQAQKTCIMEEYKDMVSNALIAYNAIGKNNAIVITMEE